MYINLKKYDLNYFALKTDFINNKLKNYLTRPSDFAIAWWQPWNFSLWPVILFAKRNRFLCTFCFSIIALQIYREILKQNRIANTLGKVQMNKVNSFDKYSHREIKQNNNVHIGTCMCLGFQSFFTLVWVIRWNNILLYWDNV